VDSTNGSVGDGSVAVMVLTELQKPPSSTTKTSVSTVGVSAKSSCTDPLKLTPTIVVDGSMVALADTTAW